MNKLSLAMIASVLTLPAQATNVFQEVIVVTGQQPDINTSSIYTEDSKSSAVDGVAMIARLPGTAMISNGSLSGQVQYRGAYGFRVGQRVNGQSFRSGGPNLMDPPMHYAPITLVESIEVSRGSAPVSFGPSLSGGVDASLKQIHFSDSSNWQGGYDLTLLGRSADGSHGLGFSGGMATDVARVFGFVSTEEGDNQEFDGGEIPNTFHERSLYGGGFGYRWSDTELEVEFRHHETDPTGNPSFAMDIDYVEADFFRSALATQVLESELKVSLGYSDVEHGMNNFAHRPAPDSGMRFRQNETEATSWTAKIDFVTPLEPGVLEYGVDSEQHDHSGRISNPNNVDFFINQLPDISQDRLGAYLNWRGLVGKGEFEAGIRADHYEDEAALASVGPALPAMPAMLAATFNGADREWSDSAVDAVVRYALPTNSGIWRMSLARKHRAPVYLERYSWLPTAASAGLADGNNYVGDLDLEIEQAWIAELGVDMSFGNAWFNPSIYFKRVDDYIQGTPVDATSTTVDSPVEMVSNANGDSSPLRFSNVDAELYGFDATYGWQFGQRWRLEGVASVVRGERRDINDDLYRISPDRVTMSLIYQPASWLVAIEVEAVREQNRVSETNSEQQTSGYGLLNLMGSWQVTNQLQLSGGVDNLLDKKFEQHLAGYNRIRDADVPVGDRLPGVGRNVFLRVSYRQ